jgi:hypothetical protein
MTSLHHEEEIDTKIYSYTMAIVMTIIIFVSIVFETVEHTAMERSADWMKPIVGTLFGEMTILGFIGLVMFTITKVGKETLDDFACNPDYGFFALDEKACLSLHGLNESNPTIHIPVEILEKGWICLENPLIELTENAHMTLFGVMMLFLSIVVTNIIIGRRQLKFWRFCEDHCVISSIKQLREKEANAYKQLVSGSCWSCCGVFCRCVPPSLLNSSCCRWCCCNAYLLNEHSICEKRLRYAAARIAFIKDNNDKARDDDHKLDPHFDMTTYLVSFHEEPIS